MAFKSKKLGETKQRWPTHEKEMYAVVHCLKLWEHYLSERPTKMYTDNVSLKYFETQPRILPKQWRWADTLARFDIELIHKPGRDNVVLNALSHKEELKTLQTQQLRMMYSE